MVEMARVPPNLDNLMNEGIAFIIDRFKHEIPKCPIGQRPVMIGRRKASHDTLKKVMKRLDLIMNVMSSMNFSGALAREARSRAPWVKKCGKLPIRENLVIT